MIYPKSSKPETACLVVFELFSGFTKSQIRDQVLLRKDTDPNRMKRVGRRGAKTLGPVKATIT